MIHMQTKKILNSHDVAAPLTPALQEVAGYINYSAQFVPHFGWKLVRIILFVCLFVCLLLLCTLASLDFVVVSGIGVVS